MKRHTAWILCATLGLLLAVGFLYPAISVLKEAFIDPRDGSFTLSFLLTVLRDPLYREGLSNALLLGAASTLGAALLALPLALLNHRFTFPGRGFLSLALLVPMILPPFVGAVGIKCILGTEGSLNALLMALGCMDRAHPYDWMAEHRQMGIVAMNALHLYPILYLNVAAALAQVNPALEQAAANLGCPPWRRFFRVTLPLIMPSLFAGSALVFIWAFTELGVPLVFDFPRVAPVQILDGIKNLDRNPLPYALTTLVLLIAGGIFLASKLAFGSGNSGATPKPNLRSEPQALGGWMGWTCSALFSGVAALACLPHLGVILLSISGFWHQTVLPTEFTSAYWQQALGSALVVPSIQNSLAYAGFATCLALALGIVSAWVITRSDLAARHLLDTLTMLPLAVPGLVLALGYLSLSQEGKPFALLVGAGGSPFLLLGIAYAIRRLPYVTRAACAGLQQCDPTLEMAARSMGASFWSTWRRVTLPLVAAHLAAGAVLAFAFSMLEVSDSLILAQRAEHFPITKATFALMSALGDGQQLAAALGVWSMAFLSASLIGAALLGGRRSGLAGG
jgi:iron(III) transport system permease protein